MLSMSKREKGRYTLGRTRISDKQVAQEAVSR
jgi:hypothetical protein